MACNRNKRVKCVLSTRPLKVLVLTCKNEETDVSQGPHKRSRSPPVEKLAN